MPDKGIKLLRCVAAKAGEGWHSAISAGSPWSILEKISPNPTGKRSWVMQQLRDELGRDELFKLGRNLGESSPSS